MVNGLNSSNNYVNIKSSTRDNVVNAKSGNDGSPGSEKLQETARVSRVEELKRQVEMGEYQLNIHRTAQKVAESLLF